MFKNADEVIFQVTRGDVFLLLVGFIIIVSIITPIIVILDKKFAETNQSRVPEKTLFTLAILGGALAEYITMNSIRHKTLHKRFMIGLPIIFISQIILFIGFIIVWLN
ncbi:MAG: DUF1294 domain-containing protein [Clostridia bacterium]